MAEEEVNIFENKEPGGKITPESGDNKEPVVETQTEQATEAGGERYSEILTKVQGASAPPDPAALATDTQSVAEATDSKAMVTRLVTLAETKGVSHAVQVARRLNDLYVLDTMHDTLADEFYEALREKGLISVE